MANHGNLKTRTFDGPVSRIIVRSVFCKTSCRPLLQQICVVTSLTTFQRHTLGKAVKSGE